MKKIFPFLILIMMIQTGFSQTKAETAVANAVETLRKAMVDGDKVALEKITTPALSYGHSGGKVEDQAAFIRGIDERQIGFCKNRPDGAKTAIVRHKLSAETNDSGKPGTVHLNILTIWQKQKGDWKLLARQAVKAQ